MRFVSASTVRSIGLASLALTACFMGCDDEAADTGVPLEQFISELRAASCERLTRCSYVPDAASCEASIPTDRGIVQAIASVVSGDLSYDPAAARTCVDAVRAHQCEGDYYLPRTLRETCDPVFGNRKSDGAACFSGSECQGVDADCEGACNDGCCQGTCKLAGGTAGLGLECDLDTPCSPDLVCLDNEGGGNQGGGSNMSCQPRVGPGASCSQPYECVEGFGCDQATGTCFQQAASGAQCNPLLAAPGCAAQAEYCDEAQSKCIPLPGDGQPCVTNAFVTDACALYAQCVMGTCQRLPGADQPCLNGECVGLLRCESNGDGGGPVSETCIPLSPAPVCVL